MSAQDIYSAGLSILALMMGREEIFYGETRESLLYEMTALYGSEALSNLGMICVSLYSAFQFFFFSVISNLVVVSGSNHVLDLVTFGFYSEAVPTCRVLCARCVKYCTLQI